MLGAVVTTSSMAVGGRCAYARPRIGAVLTQHRTDPRLGPKMHDGLQQGESPDAVLRALEAADPNLRWRQLAAIANDGTAAFFNGSRITSIAKGRVGRDCVAIGNILRTTAVVDAMVESFEANEPETLAERLVRAIEAGLAAGGELKQVKSAGLLVVQPSTADRTALPVGALPARGGNLRGARRRAGQGAAAALTKLICIFCESPRSIARDYWVWQVHASTAVAGRRSLGRGIARSGAIGKPAPGHHAGRRRLRAL
jgi:hypothetical protein